MPINFETGSGYYDGQGVFHPNTALFPTAIPGVSVTAPINPSMPYNPLPDVQPRLPNLDFPDLPEIPQLRFDFGASALGAGAGSFLGGAAISMVGPALLLAGGYMIAKKQKWL